MEEIINNNEPVVEATPVVEETRSEENQAEVVAAPQTKEEIIERLKAIAESDQTISRQEVDSLKNLFYRIIRQEAEAAQKQFVEDGGDPEQFLPEIDPLEQLFKDQFAIVREKRAAQHEAEEKLKEENYMKKLHIIEQIKVILETPDEVNKSYNDFRQLQQTWNDIKEVPSEKVAELWKTYQSLVETFYDTLKLNNEFRAYDFKKNLEIKTALCEAAEKLAEETDVVVAFRKLQQLHQQYRETGPVAYELREEIWARFKEASTVINKRHQDFFESRKQAEQENQDKKTAICEAIEAIDIDAITTMPDWNKFSEQIIEMQAEWRTIGFAPQKMNQKLFERFRAACDRFFQRKAEFFKNVREGAAERLRRKQELVERAESLKDSQAWHKTAEAYMAMRKEWQEIGGVPKKAGEELWKRFNAACDTFFEARKAANSSQHQEQAENLERKQGLIARLAAIVPEEAENLRQTLKDAQAEWDSIGHVSYKEKDKLRQAWREQMDRLYDYLGQTASKRRLERFKSEVGAGGDRMRDKLVRQADVLTQEILTYENNLGFLSLSKGSKGSSLLGELNRKVEKLRADLKEIKEKIALIDAAE